MGAEKEERDITLIRHIHSKLSISLTDPFAWGEGIRRSLHNPVLQDKECEYYDEFVLALEMQFPWI